VIGRNEKMKEVEKLIIFDKENTSDKKYDGQLRKRNSRQPLRENAFDNQMPTKMKYLF